VPEPVPLPCLALSQDQRHLLPAQAIFQLAGVASAVVLGSGTAFLYHCSAGQPGSAALHPPALYVALLGFLLFPGNLLFKVGRFLCLVG
jgi:hypothetical protein